MTEIQRAARDRAIETLRTALEDRSGDHRQAAESIVDDLILAATVPAPDATAHVEATRRAMANQDPRRG
jgi:hypothetical protein